VTLTLPWPHRLCLLRVCAQAAATSFPLSKHTGGGDTAPAFSGQCVYLQFMWEVDLHPSPVGFSSHRCFYKLSRSWLLDTRPRSRWSLSGQAQLVYLQFWEGFPSSAFRAQGTPPSLQSVFIVLIFITQFLFFPRVGVSLSRRLCRSGSGLSVEVPRTT
jgi:hypothetical protein